MIYFKTGYGWLGRLSMNRIRSVGLATLLSVLVIGIWSVSAWAAQREEPPAVKARVATVVYTCNTWGYLKHCST